MCREAAGERARLRSDVQCRDAVVVGERREIGDPQLVRAHTGVEPVHQHEEVTPAVARKPTLERKLASQAASSAVTGDSAPHEPTYTLSLVSKLAVKASMYSVRSPEPGVPGNA